MLFTLQKVFNNLWERIPEVVDHAGNCVQRVPVLDKLMKQLLDGCHINKQRSNYFEIPLEMSRKS
jgi:hypothetical protein